MRTLVLTSILFATVLLPLLFARSPRAQRALFELVVSMAGFAVLYLLALRYLYPRLP